MPVRKRPRASFLTVFSIALLLALCVHRCGSHAPGSLQLGLSGFGHATAASTWPRRAFCVAWDYRWQAGGGSWKRSALSSGTTAALGWAEGRLAASEDIRGLRNRGLWMKANKRNKKKRQQRSGDNPGDDAGPAHQPQRVTANAPVSVRTQIKYAKMKKSIERSAKAPKKTVANKYRRVKSEDYEDIVEPEDLSHIYMPDISPALMVDGYNIIFHWSKCCMMADNGDLEGARTLLVEELDTLSAMRGWTVTVVFDAYKRKGGRKRKYITPNKIEVVFTSNGESADMYVERLTEELKDAGCPNVMVATGDKLMQSLVIGAGAEVFSPDRIIEEIEICHNEAVAYTDMYMRRKQSFIEKSEMQDLLDTVRSAEDKARRRRGGGGGRGGRGSSGPIYNIEDDL